MLDNYFLWIGIGLILMVTVFRSQFKGQIGELAVAYILRDLDKEKYKIFHDIKIKNNSQNIKTTQIDHLIVSTYGIFLYRNQGL